MLIYSIVRTCLSDFYLALFLVRTDVISNFASNLINNSRMNKCLKKLLVLILALMPVFTINVYAQVGGDELPDDVPLNPGIPDGHPRPRAMARFPRSVSATPHCYYINGIIGIEADSTITSVSATVTRLDDDMTWSNVSNTNELSVIVSTDPGEYRVDVTLSDGRYYYGKYTLDE